MPRKDDIRTKQIQLSADGTKDRMIWSVFGGSVGLSVIQDGDFKNAARVRISDELRAMIELTIDKLRKAESGAKFPLVVSKWNSQEKKSERDFVLVLGKDEQRIYYIEFDAGKGIQRFTFPKISKIQTGSENMADAEQSAVRMKVFADWLKFIVPVEMVATAPTQGDVDAARTRNSTSRGRDDNQPTFGSSSNW